MTQVKFARHPSSSRLLTGSEDGLMCVFDTEVAGEEDALRSVMNAESSVSRVGRSPPRTTPAHL